MELLAHNRRVFGPIAEERRLKARSLNASHDAALRAFHDARERAGRHEPLVLEALDFAQSLDFRPARGKSYLAHPLRVATFLLELEPSIEAEVVVIALLHNVLEAARLDPSRLENRFGPAVARGIQTLTVDRTVPFEAIEEAYYKRLCAAGPGLMLVKLLDKMDNLFVLCLNPDAGVRERYLDEIERRLVPFAHTCSADLARYLEALVLDARRTGYLSEKEIA